MGVFKNGVGRPSNETIKKRNIFKGICVLLVLIIIGMTVYILNDKNDNKTYNERKNNITTKIDNKINTTTQNDNQIVRRKKKNVEIKEISTDDKGIINLFNKYNSFTWFLDIFADKKIAFSYFYEKEKVLSKDVSDSIKFIYSVSDLYMYEEYYNDVCTKNLSIQHGEVLDFEKINSKSKELFGSGIDINNIISKDKKNVLNAEELGFCFNYNSDTKQISADAGCVVGDGSRIDMKTKIINVYKNDDKLIIENKLMFTYYNVNNDNMLILKKYDDEDDEKYKISEFPNQENVLDKIKIDDYLDKLDTYRWTFKENTDGSYTFESVEKVK